MGTHKHSDFKSSTATKEHESSELRDDAGVLRAHNASWIENNGSNLVVKKISKSGDRRIELSFVVRTAEDLDNARTKAYKLLVP